MIRRPILIVAVALFAALTGLIFIGRRVLERDRDALYARYAGERLQSMEEAGRGLSGDIIEIGEDLDLASILLQGAKSSQLAARELHAIATIKREYLVMDARTDDGTSTRVVALDAAPDVATRSDQLLGRLLDLATRDPGRLHVSGAVGESGPAKWYRVFARRPVAHGPAVAVVVDMAIVLSRMKLQRSSLFKFAVLDSEGAAAPTSDRELAAFPADHRLHENWSTKKIDGDTARRLGLPSTTAMLVRVPLQVADRPPWTLLAAASTRSLEAQDEMLARRVLAGGGLVLLLLISAAVYVIHNTSRAASLRERLRHVDRLAHLTEKAEKILDHIPSGVLTLSEDRRVTSANRWFTERMRHDITGLSMEQAFRSARVEDISVVSRLVDRAITTRDPQSVHHAKVALFGQDASLGIHAIPLARAVADVSVLVVFEDLTPLKRIEDRLLHSEKLVTAGQLAAGIAHEIGTPLNVARGRVELTLSHLGPEHAEADNHRLVIDQIDRVTRLIQQLLDYVRSTPASVQDVSPARSMHAVKELLNAQAAKRGVVVNVEAPESLVLRGDPDHVQQILVNLVLNAIDACDRGGRVDIRAASRSDTIHFEIVDTGHGIAREIQPQIFDPFFTTKKRGQGTGLGLWVVAQLVRANAAEIELESAPGTGTTVRIVWPRVS